MCARVVAQVPVEAQISVCRCAGLVIRGTGFREPALLVECDEEALGAAMKDDIKSKSQWQTFAPQAGLAVQAFSWSLTCGCSPMCLSFFHIVFCFCHRL